MVDDEGLFREKIRNSFSNVKNDISNLGISLNKLEDETREGKETILNLNSKFELLKDDLKDIKAILSDLKQPSTGNEGVINNHQQSTVNNHQQSTTTEKELKSLENDFSKLFKNLTDREFSVFMAIYELEKQFNETNYSQIANRLNLTETTVRGTVNRLISKKLPVSKERLFNGKTSLSLKKDFHDLNLLGKLVRLRQNPLDQQTLF
jgi:chromosome segregation ATPase